VSIVPLSDRTEPNPWDFVTDANPTIAGLARRVVDLEERCEDLALDAESYRLLAQQAIHVLHDTHEQRNRATATVDKLHGALRATRAELTRYTKAAGRGEAA
jgi:hypothetical protein